MSLTSSSWRRVASTHSLSDLLLEEESTGQGSPADTTGHTLLPPTTATRPAPYAVILLGLTLIAVGTFGLLSSVFVAYSCFPTSWQSLHAIQCSDLLQSLFYQAYIERGLHGLVVPALGIIGRFWEWTCGARLPLVDRATAFLEYQYPVGKEAFLRAVVDRGENVSEMVLYCFGIVPVLLGPVTLAMIAMNWFSLKVFRHN